MTRIASETVHRGDTATFNFVHIEKRGNVDAQNVRLKFYLSPNDVISANDHEIGSFTWNTFKSWGAVRTTCAYQTRSRPASIISRNRIPQLSHSSWRFRR